MATSRRGLFRALAGVLAGAPLIPRLQAPAHQGIGYALQQGQQQVTFTVHIDGRTVAEHMLPVLRDAVRKHGIRPL